MRTHFTFLLLSIFLLTGCSQSDGQTVYESTEIEDVEADEVHIEEPIKYKSLSFYGPFPEFDLTGIDRTITDSEIISEIWALTGSDNLESALGKYGGEEIISLTFTAPDSMKKLKLCGDDTVIDEDTGTVYALKEGSYSKVKLKIKNYTVTNLIPAVNADFFAIDTASENLLLFAAADYDFYILPANVGNFTENWNVTAIETPELKNENEKYIIHHVSTVNGYTEVDYFIYLNDMIIEIRFGSERTFYSTDNDTIALIKRQFEEFHHLAEPR